MKKLKENKVFRVITTILRVLFIVFILLFIITVYLQRFSDNKVSLFKYRMFTVISESMKPKYTIGDVLFAKEVDPSTIKVGDNVSYLGTTGDVRGKVVTHQVVKIEKEENGKYAFHTKGLSNLIEDPVVYEEQLFGKVVYKSFILSIIYKIIATKIGFYLCIIVPLIIMIGYEIFVTLLEREDKKRKKITTE